MILGTIFLLPAVFGQTYRVELEIDPPWGAFEVSCLSSGHPERYDGIFSSKDTLAWEFTGVSSWFCVIEWDDTACLSNYLIPGLCQGMTVFSSNFGGSAPVANNTWLINGFGATRIKENGTEVNDYRYRWDGSIPPEFNTPPNDAFHIIVDVRPPSGEVYVRCHDFYDSMFYERTFTSNGTLEWDFVRDSIFTPVWTCYAVWDEDKCVAGWTYGPNNPADKTCSEFPVYGRVFDRPGWIIPRANNTWLIDGSGKARISEGEGVPVHDFPAEWDLDDAFLIRQTIQVEIAPGDSEIYLVCHGTWGDDGSKDADYRETFTTSRTFQWDFLEKDERRRNWACNAFNEVGCLSKWVTSEDGMSTCAPFPVYGTYGEETVQMANHTWLIDSSGKIRTEEWGVPVNDLIESWDPFQ
ncbi:hypothetical protein Fcan01_17049 [Folsomia candida]|uniref:Uncharacterized protein n=2 Tax=Folsomia candida TaxID=158441 RepID=A0A226DSD2_FOLCA|nr:hypothetical protein Fcan01_17049 [Folsomia candida]